MHSMHSVKKGAFNKTIGCSYWLFNMPFPSSPPSFFQSESKYEIVVMVINSNFNMNEN